MIILLFSCSFCLFCVDHTKRNLTLIFVGTPMVTVVFVFRTSLLSSLLSCLKSDDSNVRKVSFKQFVSVGFYLEGAKESGISEFPDIYK